MPASSFELAPRAAHLVHAPSSLTAAHAMCQADPFHSRTNPQGYIQLGTAENYLLWDLLQPALCAPRALEPCDTHYGPMYGSERLRACLTAFLQRRTQHKLHADRLVVASGAAAVIDMLAWTLFAPKDGILLATPYYAGFDFALCGRAGLTIVPVRTEADAGFAPTVAQLQKAYEQARQAGINVRGMLLANPHNPTGHVAGPQQMRAWLDFARAHALEVLVDEIYAHSVYAEADFESSMQQLRPNVHVIYGLAKDFALSGFKVGMVYSENTKVIAALQALAYLSPVATDTQAAVCRLLEDATWTDNILAANQERLAHASQVTARAIAAMGGTVCPAQAGLFLWVNLRPFLCEDSFAGEATLHRALLQGARVNLGPGAVFHGQQPGWFRLCFASPAEVLAAGLDRLAAALQPLALGKNFSATGVYAPLRA